MYPYLEDNKVPKKHHTAIVKYLIDQLANNLIKLQTRHARRLIVVDARKIIDPNNGCLNEIHPKPAGFKRLAEEIYNGMAPYRA
jgi:hypothetical protein